MICLTDTKQKGSPLDNKTPRPTDYRDRQGKLPPFFGLIWDKEFGAGDEAVGVGEIITISINNFTPLLRGAIIFGGDRGKGIALLDNVDSCSRLVARDLWLGVTLDFASLDHARGRRIS